jgi:hypothetical protein
MGGLSGRDAGGRGFGPEEGLGGPGSELVEAALGRVTPGLAGCGGAGVVFPAWEGLPVGGDWAARGCPDLCCPPGLELPRPGLDPAR